MLKGLSEALIQSRTDNAIAKTMVHRSETHFMLRYYHIMKTANVSFKITKERI